MTTDHKHSQEDYFLEKYRPQHLKDLIGQTHFIETLQQHYLENNLSNLLFYGPPGTGKTSAAHCVARQFHGEHYRPMVLELNASDDRGIDVIRQQVKSFSTSQSLNMSSSSSPSPSHSSSLKFVFLDEADSLTRPAQNALRRVMEMYMKRVCFILICNYLNKLIDPLVSRCFRFRFAPLPMTAMVQKISEIATAESIPMEQDTQSLLARFSQGDFRKALTTLKSISTVFKGEVITTKHIYQWTQQPSPAEIEALILVATTQSLAIGCRHLDEMTLKFPLSTLIHGIHLYLISDSTIPIPKPRLDFAIFFHHLAKLEDQISKGGSDSIQKPNLIALFHLAQKTRIPLDEEKKCK